MTTRWRRAGRRRKSWHNQQNCIKTQGGRHKKRTALLAYPFKSRSAASVSASAAPDALRPLFCWNWRSACSVSAPKSPSAPCRGRGESRRHQCALQALHRVAGIADLHQPYSPREHRQHPVKLPAARACVCFHAAAGAVQNPQWVRLHDDADVVVVAAVSGGGVSARQGVPLCARFMRAENEFAAPELPRAAQGIQVVHGVACRPVCAVDAAPLPAAAANRADDQPDAVAVAVRAVAPQSVARISSLNPPYIRQKFVDGHVFTPIQPMRKGGLGCKKTEQPKKPLRHQFTLDYASTRKA